jgi:hypothetical protein
MSGQQYQGTDTDVIVQFVKEGSWTLDQIIQARKDASPSDTEWITSLDEALSILQEPSK